MQTKQVYLILHIKDTQPFQILKYVVEQEQAPLKYITPQALNAGIMYTPSCNELASSWTTLRVLQHEVSYIDILPSSIRAHPARQPITQDSFCKTLKDCRCCVVVTAFDINNKTAVPVHTSMHNKTPSKIVDGNTRSGTLHLTLLCIASFPDLPHLRLLITPVYKYRGENAWEIMSFIGHHTLSVYHMSIHLTLPDGSSPAFHMLCD